MKKRNRRTNKFTNKKHSLKGLMACVLDIISFAALVAVFMMSYTSAGNVGAYLGLTGLASLILSLLAFVFAVQGLREETTFNTLPAVALILAIITIVCWGGMLVIGGLMMR